MLQSVQDAVHLGHHISTINKDRVVANDIAKFLFVCDWHLLHTSMF